ncbi:hypothetical protein C8R45DRAFT_983888 [Mycena sanguinolenta]|nr:hypothetical protein C8R45DRAFT_983888 [Mycena sanguinolenta]
MPKRAREPEESEPELWAVEKIIGAQRTDESLCKESTDPLSPSFGQGWEYLVKWDRYDISDSTWEPFTHLRNCQELLRNFWEDAGEEAMVTNIPNFEILVRPEWSEPVSSRAKKKASNAFVQGFC